ncbi:flagellar hook protein FlgE [Microbacteriaceae bacterium K1510]|nr:flagellar hook protein FlgE [Microbacteriaceae bacterium K1510]
MSLTGALSSAVSALSAQSQSIAMVSDNLANSSTYGYKTTYASFEELVTGSSSAGYSSGGVMVNSRSDISKQGLLVSSTTATNLAISGSGFFVVSPSTNSKEVYYTRNGAFSTDSSGYLVNNGYYLMGWRTDANGNVVGNESSSTLSAIDTNVVTSTAAATTNTSIKANLPADAATGATFTSDMSLYDSLGTAHSVEITWTKTGTNTWTASFGNPTLSSDTSTTTGTVSSSAITVTFNSDGTLASTSPSPATLSITGWTTSAADSTISLSLGAVGKADGLTQYSTGTTSPTVDVTSITSDGMAYGTLTGVSVGDDGIVRASYSNGQTMAIYKIPVATFTNANGLEAMSGGIYASTQSSGNSTLHEAGAGGAGVIKGGELESSATDSSEEFSTMIAAQQAYSSSAQVITAVNKMFDTLLSAVR